MGGVGAAIGGDAYAGYVNAAGLGLVEGTQIAAAGRSWFDNEFQEFAPAVAYQVVDGIVLGLMGAERRLGEVQTYSSTGTPAGSFVPIDRTVVVGGSFGIPRERRFLLGMNLRALVSEMDDQTESEFGVDLGGLAKFPVGADHEFRVALAVNDVAGFLDVVDVADSIGPAVRVGGAYRFQKALAVGMDVEVDGSVSPDVDDRVYLYLGVEGRIGFHRGHVRIRAGGQSRDVADPDASYARLGTGVAVGFMGVEIAYAVAGFAEDHPVDDFNSPEHTFAVSYTIDLDEL